MAQRRAWVFTEHQWEAMLAGLQVDGLPEGIRYIVLQLERCPDTGRLHLQGYVELLSSLRMSSMKSVLSGTAHFELRRGTRDEARDYCMKEETRVDGPWEYGDWRKGGAGARNDLLACKEMLDEGKEDKEIADAHFGSWLRYNRAFAMYKALKGKPRDGQTMVTNLICYGKSGVGKTRWVHEQYPGAFWKSAQNKWWDGYAGQDVVVFDDHNSPWFTWDVLLRILDLYPCGVETKGGMVSLCSTCNIFTTTESPRAWYRSERLVPRFDALLRRLQDPHGTLLLFEKIPNGRKITRIPDSDYNGPDFHT